MAVNRATYRLAAQHLTVAGNERSLVPETAPGRAVASTQEVQPGTRYCRSLATLVLPESRATCGWSVVRLEPSGGVHALAHGLGVHRGVPFAVSPPSATTVGPIAPCHRIRKEAGCHRRRRAGLAVFLGSRLGLGHGPGCGGSGTGRPRGATQEGGRIVGPRCQFSAPLCGVVEGFRGMVDLP